MPFGMPGVRWKCLHTSRITDVGLRGGSGRQRVGEVRVDGGPGTVLLTVAKRDHGLAFGGAGRRRDGERGQLQIVSDLVEYLAHVMSVAIAIRRVACGRGEDELIELAGHTRDHRTRRRDVVVQPLVGQAKGGIAGERCSAGEHLEHQDAG